MRTNFGKILPTVLLSLALIISASCGNGGQNGTATTSGTTAAELTTTVGESAAETTTTEAGSGTTVTTSAPESSVSETGAGSDTPGDDLSIGNGVWWNRDSEGKTGTYCIFNNGKGSIKNLEMGSGVNFDYEQNGYDLLFRFEGDEDVTRAKITDVGVGMIHIRFDNSSEDRLLRYVTDDIGGFGFFSIGDIVSAARAYYSSSHNGAEAGSAETELSEDDWVLVKFKGSAGDESYYINPITGNGYTYNGEAVDLGLASAGSIEDMMPSMVPEPWHATVIQRQTLLDEGCFMGVRYLGYIAPDSFDPKVNEPYIKNILEVTGTAEDFPFSTEIPNGTGPVSDIYGRQHGKCQGIYLRPVRGRKRS